MVLEVLVVKKLAAAPAHANLIELRQLLARAETLVSKGDFANCHLSNMEFHDRMAALTGNATLLQNYRRLVNELSLFRHQAHAELRDAFSLRAAVADHQAVLEAVVEGDGRLAGRLICGHVEASRERLQRLLAEQNPAVPVCARRKHRAQCPETLDLSLE
jgi:DNA-binding GntR family transcriptional regulator